MSSVCRELSGLTGAALLFLEQNAQMRTTPIVMGKTLYVVPLEGGSRNGTPTFFDGCYHAARLSRI
jgi:hypothetical protein